MKKLLRLKAWLTIPEAARHLSLVLSEDVSPADVLRFGLDGHLTLSVNFVNHARARRGKIVPMEHAQLIEFSADMAKAWGPKFENNKLPVRTLKGININGKEVLELDDEITVLHGVFDLPLIGGEKLDIEHFYQGATGGPPVTLHNLQGAFVQGDEDTMYQLHESVDENEFRPGSKAKLRELKERIASEKLGPAEADRLLKEHAEARERYLQKRKTRPSDDYYPAQGLPADSVLVVRTRALRDFEARLEAMETESSPELGPRAQTTYQNIVGGLLGLMLGTSPSGNRQSAYQDQAAIIDALLTHYPGKPGISKRTLESKFAAARRMISAS